MGVVAVKLSSFLTYFPLLFFFFAEMTAVEPSATAYLERRGGRVRQRRTQSFAIRVSEGQLNRDVCGHRMQPILRVKFVA